MHVITFGYGYDKWLCDGVLFELHTGLSGVFAPAEDALRRESACRVEWLGYPCVALARLAGPCVLW